MAHFSAPGRRKWCEAHNGEQKRKMEGSSLTLRIDTCTLHARYNIWSTFSPVMFSFLEIFLYSGHCWMANSRPSSFVACGFRRCFSHKNSTFPFVFFVCCFCCCFCCCSSLRFSTKIGRKKVVVYPVSLPFSFFFFSFLNIEYLYSRNVERLVDALASSPLLFRCSLS